MQESNITINNNFFSTLDKLSAATEIANEINKLEFKEENYTIDFSIKEGKMICTKNWNTCIKFDISQESVNLRSIVNYFNSDTEEISHEMISQFDQFRKSIGELLCLKYKDVISENLLLKIFGTNSKATFNMKCIEIDISDLPEIDYVLVVKKMAPQGVQTDPVTEELFKINMETGKDYNLIIEEAKKSGDLRFKYVDSCEKRKHFFEVCLYLMVDYSKI